MSYTTDKKLKCDMTEECNEPCTHMDEKGFIYCKEHGEHRKLYKRCRKLRPHELKKLQNGEPLARY